MTKSSTQPLNCRRLVSSIAGANTAEPPVAERLDRAGQVGRDLEGHVSSLPSTISSRVWLLSPAFVLAERRAPSRAPPPVRGWTASPRSASTPTTPIANPQSGWRVGVACSRASATAQRLADLIVGSRDLLREHRRRRAAGLPAG